MVSSNQRNACLYNSFDATQYEGSHQSFLLTLLFGRHVRVSQGRNLHFRFDCARWSANTSFAGLQFWANSLMKKGPES